MKQKEKDIIKYLRKGQRLNISEISRKLNCPISTISDRIKRIEKKYVIKRTYLLDFEKSGYLANEMLSIKIEFEKRLEFLDFLKKEICVNSIYYTNSPYNFLVDIVCKDHFSLDQWVEHTKSRFKIETKSFQILKVEEKEKFVPN